MWKVGKKEIFVGIALEETDRGSIYYVLANIDRKALNLIRKYAICGEDN